LVTGACSGELYYDGRMVVNDDIKLRMILSTKKGSRRCTSSPGFFLDGRRSESWSEVTSTSPIPMSLLQKGTAEFDQHRPSLLNSFSTQGPRSKAELQDPSMVTGVAFIADERARLG
jgi:hypothetical protein